jgi:pimeloyl-ACP methyl ester carboxylesterase
MLAEHYRLIILELRGCGDSPISTDISIHTFISDILELLDFLKIEKVHVCGLSLGGIKL